MPSSKTLWLWKHTPAEGDPTWHYGLGSPSTPPMLHGEQLERDPRSVGQTRRYDNLPNAEDAQVSVNRVNGEPTVRVRGRSIKPTQVYG